MFLQRLLDLGDEIVALEDLLRSPADLAGDEHLPAFGGDAVGEAFGLGPVLGVEDLHGCYSWALSLKRWILPVCVLGSAATNLTERGYL